MIASIQNGMDLMGLASGTKFVITVSCFSVPSWWTPSRSGGAPRAEASEVAAPRPHPGRGGVRARRAHCVQ